MSDSDVLGIIITLFIILILFFIFLVIIYIFRNK